MTTQKFPAPEAARVCAPEPGPPGPPRSSGSQPQGLPRGRGRQRPPGAARPAGPEEGARPRQRDGKPAGTQPGGEAGPAAGALPPAVSVPAEVAHSSRSSVTRARGWPIWWGASCTSSFVTSLSCRWLLHFNDFKGDFLNVLFPTCRWFHRA